MMFTMKILGIYKLLKYTVSIRLTKFWFYPFTRRGKLFICLHINNFRLLLILIIRFGM